MSKQKKDRKHENARKSGIALPVADGMANAPAEPAGQLQPLVDL